MTEMIKTVYPYSYMNRLSVGQLLSYGYYLAFIVRRCQRVWQQTSILSIAIVENYLNLTGTPRYFNVKFNNTVELSCIYATCAKNALLRYHQDDIIYYDALCILSLDDVSVSVYKYNFIS